MEEKRIHIHRPERVGEKKKALQFVLPDYGIEAHMSFHFEHNKANRHIRFIHSDGTQIATKLDRKMQKKK